MYENVMLPIAIKIRVTASALILDTQTKLRTDNESSLLYLAKPSPSYQPLRTINLTLTSDLDLKAK